MTSFLTIDGSVTTSAAMYVEGADLDRTLTIRAGNVVDATAVSVYIGYASNDVNFRLPETDTDTERATAPAVTVVLPANCELWAKSTDTPASIWIFVGGTP